MDDISSVTQKLEKIYPIEASYGSKCSLYQRALKEGHITKEIFDKARAYYGKLWNYTGD